MYIRIPLSTAVLVIAVSLSLIFKSFGALGIFMTSSTFIQLFLISKSYLSSSALTALTIESTFLSTIVLFAKNSGGVCTS